MWPQVPFATAWQEEEVQSLEIRQDWSFAQLESVKQLKFDFDATVFEWGEDEQLQSLFVYVPHHAETSSWR